MALLGCPRFGAIGVPVHTLHKKLPKEIASLRAKRAALEADYAERRLFLETEIQKQSDLLERTRQEYVDTLTHLGIAKEVLGAENVGTQTGRLQMPGPRPRV